MIPHTFDWWALYLLFKIVILSSDIWAQPSEMSDDFFVNTAGEVAIRWMAQDLISIRQQAITWTNIDPDLCLQMVSLGHNGLMSWNICSRIIHNSKQPQSSSKISPTLTVITNDNTNRWNSAVHPAVSTSLKPFTLANSAADHKDELIRFARLDLRLVFRVNHYLHQLWWDH